jgi:hypothetical protein
VGDSNFAECRSRRWTQPKSLTFPCWGSYELQCFLVPHQSSVYREVETRSAAKALPCVIIISYSPRALVTAPGTSSRYLDLKTKFWIKAVSVLSSGKFRQEDEANPRSKPSFKSHSRLLVFDVLLFIDQEWGGALHWENLRVPQCFWSVWNPQFLRRR